MVNPVVERHLREARRELIEQRTQLDEDIAAIDAMLGRGAGSVVTAGPTPGVVVAPAIKPVMRDAVLDYFVQAKRAKTGDVVDAVAAQYGWSAASVRSQVAKLSHEGELGQERRGVYVLIEPKTSSAADSDESAAEAEMIPTGEGGEPHAQDDQGHHSDNSRWENDGDRGGYPAVVGE